MWNYFSFSFSLFFTFKMNKITSSHCQYDDHHGDHRHHHVYSPFFLSIFLFCVFVFPTNHYTLFSCKRTAQTQIKAVDLALVLLFWCDDDVLLKSSFPFSAKLCLCNTTDLCCTDMALRVCFWHSIQGYWYNWMFYFKPKSLSFIADYSYTNYTKLHILLYL